MNPASSLSSRHFEVRRSGRLAQPRSVSSSNALRKRHLRRADGESWIMVYLDVITLLLTFFILMLASLNSDRLAGTTEAEEPVKQTPGEVAKLQPDLELANRLRESLTLKQRIEGVQIKVEPGRVNLQLPEKILFETGKADLIGLAQEVLKQIVPILLEDNFFLSVEGHTDDVPISTERFPSNWELSTARAATVIRHLQAEGIPIERMRAVGYANTNPVASNETDEGHSANRRVTLVIHLEGKERYAQNSL